MFLPFKVYHRDLIGLYKVEAVTDTGDGRFYWIRVGNSLKPFPANDFTVDNA